MSEAASLSTCVESVRCRRTRILASATAQAHSCNKSTGSGLDPGAAALQFTAALSGRNRAWRASRPGHGHSLPQAGGLIQDRPERAPDPSARPLLGRKPRKAGTGWPVVPVSGRGLRQRAGRRRCPLWYRPQEVPGREQEEQETGRRGGSAVPGLAVPGRPAAGSRTAAGKALVRSGRGARAGTTAGSAADPRTTAVLSHSPRPAACRNPPFRFSSPAMGALTGPEPAQGGPG